MNYECFIVNVDSIPKGWAADLREKVVTLPPGKALQYVLKRKQTVSGLITAWYRLCEASGKKAKSRQRKMNHELGTTVWLWFE